MAFLRVTPTIMYQKFLLIIALCLLWHTTQGQLYLGVMGDFGNKLSMASTGRVKSEMSSSIGLQLFLDTEIRKNLIMKSGLSGGFVNQKIVVPALGPFEVIPMGDLFHVSGHLNFGKRFHFNEKFYMDVLGGGGVSFYGGEGSGGSYGPGSASDAVFFFDMTEIENNAKGFAELLIQTHLHRILLVGLRYQKHFSNVIHGTYTLLESNQPATGGSMMLAPECLSILVSFKVASVKSRRP